LGVTTFALGPFFPRLAQPSAGLFFHAKNDAMAKQKQPPGDPMTLGDMAEAHNQTWLLKTRDAMKSMDADAGPAARVIRCGIFWHPRLISSLLVSVLFFAPGLLVIAADNPRLIQGMNLSAARKAVQQSGWIQRGKSYCWSTSRIEHCGGVFSDDFLLKVPELTGHAGDTSLLYLCYTDGFGKRLELSFGFDERFVVGRRPNTDSLIRSMKLAYWRIEDGECAYTL
jgi:hypothetical protein